MHYVSEIENSFSQYTHRLENAMKDSLKRSIKSTRAAALFVAILATVALTLSIVAIIIVINGMRVYEEKVAVWRVSADDLVTPRTERFHARMIEFVDTLNSLRDDVNDPLDDATEDEKQVMGNMTILLNDVDTMETQLNTLLIELAVLKTFVNTVTLTSTMRVLNCNDEIVPLNNADTNTIFVLNGTDCTIVIPMTPGFRARFVTSSVLLDLSNTIQLASGNYYGYIQSITTKVYHHPGATEDSIVAPCSTTPTTPGDFVEIEVINSTYAIAVGETTGFGFDWGANC